jgi:hypothetical protein
LRLNICVRPYVRQVVSGAKSGIRVKYLSAFVLLCLLTLSGAASAFAQSPSLVSVNRDGTGSGDGASFYTSSVTVTNGRQIVFTSKAANLVALPDANNTFDVFVRDLSTGVTTLVSVNAAGTGAGNGKSGVRAVQDIPEVTISDDGRYVAFTSSASDLVANDTNGKEDAFVRDLQTGTTILASVNSAGTNGGNNNSFLPSISPDGSVVIFNSLANDLAPNDTNNTTDVFARNLKTGVTTLVSYNGAGTASANGPSSAGFVSADGQLVQFNSTANNLVANDSNGSRRDVFVRNLQTGATTLVSVSADGLGSGNSDSSGAILSRDGRFVVFNSNAGNLTTLADTNATADVFVRDLAAGKTTLVSVNQAGTGAGDSFSFITSRAMISADGNRIVFGSGAGNLVANDTNGQTDDVFVRDIAAGTTTLVSINSAGTGSGNLASSGSTAAISADGRFVAFDSIATDLTAGSHQFQDIYVRDLQQAKTTLASVNTSGTGGGNSFSSSPTISADGSIVAFFSEAGNLVSNDTNGALLDVFTFALPQGSSSLQFSAAAYTVVEGNPTASITVTRTGTGGGAVSATVTTSNGTAVAGQDYTAVSQTVNFAAGETAAKTLTIPITDDALVESAETVNLTLGNPTGGAVLGSIAAATLTITDNDSCSYTVSPGSLPQFSAAGGQGSFQMNAPAGCSWTATSLVPWLTITGGASGTGNGTISFTVAPNNGLARTGQILHTSDSFYAVSQAAGCAFSINPATRNVAAEGEEFNVAVTASDAACVWTATTNVPESWMAVKSGASGTGNGSVTLSVTPNISNATRTLTATIAGQVFTATQPSLPSQVSGVSFSRADYSFAENEGRATLRITRSGNLSATVTVRYATIDDPAAVPCDPTVKQADGTPYPQGAAYARCDYATTIDTVTFSPGESLKDVAIPLIDDAHVEGAETLRVALSSPSEGVGTFQTTIVTINDNDAAGQPNPIFSTPFFVRQQYLDFLSREPEAGEPWSGVLNRCSDVNNNPACDRLLVSQSFFGSPEFRLKGFYVFNFYRVAFGRRPSYEEVIPDMRSVTGATEQEVYQKRAAFPASFIARAEFKGLYDGLTDAAFVNTLLDRYGLQQVTTPDPANPEGGTKVTLTRPDLINRLGQTGGQTLTRSQVLRAVVESNEVGAAEFNKAFVAMQYYGYLRRTPEEDGYQAWLRVINQDPQNVRIMVDGFMNSTEYRLRFGHQ